jgi:hypothetical protein
VAITLFAHASDLTSFGKGECVLPLHTETFAFRNKVIGGYDVIPSDIPDSEPFKFDLLQW